MRKVALAVLLLLVAVPAFAQTTKPTFDFTRGAGGLDARVLWVQHSDKIAFDPAAWLSYSLTENMNAAIVQGWNTDQGVDPTRLGLRLYVPDQPIQVALGVNYLHDWSNGGHAYSVGAYGGWKLNNYFAAAASAEKVLSATDGSDPINFYLALRAKAFGGGN